MEVYLYTMRFWKKHSLTLEGFQNLVLIRKYIPEEGNMSLVEECSVDP